MYLPRLHMIFVVLLAFPCVADDSPIEMKIKEVRFGTFKLQSQGVVGSYIAKRSWCQKVVEETDQIEMRPGNTFGVQAKVQANRGKKLVIFHRWILPKSEGIAPERRLRQSSLSYIKNGSTVTACYILEHPWEMIPGEWTVEVFLLGIDEHPKVVIKKIEKRQPLLLYKKTFQLSVHESVVH